MSEVNAGCPQVLSKSHGDFFAVSKCFQNTKEFLKLPHFPGTQGSGQVQHCHHPLSATRTFSLNDVCDQVALCVAQLSGSHQMALAYLSCRISGFRLQQYQTAHGFRLTPRGFQPLCLCSYCPLCLQCHLPLYLMTPKLLIILKVSDEATSSGDLPQPCTGLGTFWCSCSILNL